MEILKKLNIDIPYNPGTSLLGIYPRKQKHEFEKIHAPPMWIAALFTIAKKYIKAI